MLSKDNLKNMMKAQSRTEAVFTKKAGVLDSYIDLADVIDVKNCKVENNDPDCVLSPILTKGSNDGPGLKSDEDMDEMLLIVVNFQCRVRLRSIAITGITADGVSGPATVRIFKNHPEFDFNDCEESTPEAVLELKGDDVKDGAETDLKYVRFQDVQSVTLFVASNQGDTAVTGIKHIKFIGTTRDKVDLSKLKKG